MDIAVVAPEPAETAVVGALVDTEATVTADERPSSGSFGVVVGEHTERFRRADETFDRWIGVEIGGVGGRGVTDLDASVAAFTSESGCYDCLRDRVAAATEPSARASVDRSAVRYAGAVGGRWAVRLWNGAPLGGRLVELPGPERRFLPVPGCDCHDPPTGFERSNRSVSLSAAVDRFEAAVDDRVGVVTEVGERESFPVPYYVARTTDTTGFSDARCGEFGGGAAVDWNAAYAKSVGEALERYCAGVYRTDRLRTAPTEAVIDGVAVDQFVRPGDATPVAPDEPLAWVDGARLATGEYAALPAGFVHFPPPREFVPPITTGLGVGNSVDEALLAGLTEVIERDATMLAWYSTFEPLELRVETDRYEQLEKRARAESLRVTTLLCTQDVDIPVVAAAVHRDGEWPQFAAGSAAGVDAATAGADAVAEALQNWTELRGMGPERAAKQGGAIGRYASFPAAAREFVDADVTVAADEVSTTPADPLDAVVQRVEAAGLSVYAARLTTTDVASLGFEAVRVLVPGAQPLFTSEPFFGDRVETVPSKLGFESRPDRGYHPFP